MKINKKNIAVLFSTALLMATSLGNAATSFADTTTADTNVQTTDTTANNDSANIQTKSTDSATTPNVQANSQVDVAAIKAAMLNAINDLRAQNGLNSLTSVEVLNNYAQQRSDSFNSNGTGIDKHVGWNSALMAPYNHNAEENIGQIPITMVPNDSVGVANAITQEFYIEKNDRLPDYGHRKNMLNPYVGYIGFGITFGENGMLYFSQEIGNDSEYAARSTYEEKNNYYYTTKNDYSNVSKNEVLDSTRRSADYTQNGNKYIFGDIRGGVSTRDTYVHMYDRDGNIYNNLRLAPNTDWSSDIVSIINGIYFLHVSTNGFVKAVDVLPWATFLAGITVTTNTDAPIYDDFGIPSGRYAPAGTTWVTDRRSIDFGNNTKYCRIGTNAWLSSDDINTIKG
ncbi:CAP domain-containing protein [Companilactobacillus ginsenosidimutans]|uniref:SCP domain-containing protein n=1 Tax=Companilactobacillus ginsenosidimutans TaxID=1007676 RepID=A0A0H4QYL5_9LACO|nr:CAP domain-containing protein [Companilactobacillus ginsenosidimutans]AKP66570.1 hypothetical protein ABM34_02705 [Companilactobacillus ginsenosidimutans]